MIADQIPVQTKTEAKSQSTQNKTRHKQWLMLECQFWIFHLFVTGLSLYVISEFAKIESQTNSFFTTKQYRYGQQAIENWKKGYIIDIKQVKTDNCPQGYTELINYVWPGTYTGCYCQTVINNHASQYVMAGACSNQLISFGCTTISEISKQVLKMWKGKKLLCYKRVKSFNFYNSSSSTTSEGTQTISCATNQTYEVKGLPGVTCPQTAISNSSIGTSTQVKLSLDTTNSQFLYFQNQQNYPISDFKISQYNFCPFFNESNISPDKNGNYILQVINQSITCDGIDPRIVQFDYLTEQGFYTNNTRVYNLISSLPAYPRPSITYAYKLGFIRYAAWTYQCRSSDTHNLLEATRHLNFKHVSDKAKLILYIGIPCLIIVAVLSRALYIIRHIFQIKSKKQYNMLILTDFEVGEQIPNLNIVKSFKKELLFFILGLLLLFGSLIIVSIGAYEFVAESMWIKQMFIKSCSQDHLNWIFRYNQDIVDRCQLMTGRSMMFIIVIIVVETIHFILRSRVGDLKKTQVITIQALSNQGLIKSDLDEKKNNLVADESMNIQDSSQIILRKEKEELKVYELDNFMSGQLQQNAGETGLNFYSQSIEQENLQIAKKKKKKIKRKNLFKQGQEK